MELQDQFDVADLLGHPAFDHLSLAMKVYQGAREERLFEPEEHEWQQCLSAGARLEFYRKEELKWCVHAVVLFQAMMEKVPYFVPTVGSGLKSTNKGRFADSWRDLLRQIKDEGDRQVAEAAFDAYYSTIYKTMRNPIIHGRKASDIRMVNEIRVPGVFDGMQEGWTAFDFLVAEAFASDKTHEPSWARMCAIHQIQVDDLDPSSYPDIAGMVAQFNRRHMSGFNAAASDWREGLPAIVTLDLTISAAQ